MSSDQTTTSRRQFVSKASVGVLASSIIGLSGCASTSEKSSDKDSTLKVGGLYALSGPYSTIGTDQQVATEVAIKHLKEDDANISFDHIGVDTKLDPTEGLRAAKDLVENENVDVLTGTASSSVAKAVQNYAKKTQTPFMITTSTSQSLTGSSCNEYTFRSNTHAYQNQKADAEWAMKNLGKRYVTMGADYSWGHESVEAFVEVASEHGGERVDQVWPKLGAKDYSSHLQKVASTDADLLVIRASGTDGIRSAKQVASFGIKDQMDVITNQTSIAAQGAGDALIGNYGMVPYHWNLTSEQTGNDKNERFVSDFRSVGDGSRPSTYGATSYVGLQFFAKAAMESGSTNAADLVPALEGLSYESLKGPVTIRECDHQTQQNIWSTVQVASDGTDVNYPVPKYNAKHPAGTNLKPCEESGCTFEG